MSSLHYSLDYEYWIRLALAGAQFMHLPEAVARFRLSSGSKTVGQTAVMAQEQLRVLEVLAARPDLPARLGLTPQQVRQRLRRHPRPLPAAGFLWQPEAAPMERLVALAGCGAQR